MEAFFQSAINGMMQVKEGFLQVGEAEKRMMKGASFNGYANGFGRRVDEKKSHSGSRICLSFEEYVIMPHI